MLVSNEDDIVNCLIEDDLVFELVVELVVFDVVVLVVVLVVLDYVGDIVIGQCFSVIDVDDQWYLVGLSEGGVFGSCEFYECGSLFEGVLMMVQDEYVLCFDLVLLDGLGEIIIQFGLFGLCLGMLCEDVLWCLFGGSIVQLYVYVFDVGEYFIWQDLGLDLVIWLEIVDGVIMKMYWGVSGVVEMFEGCV